MNMELLYWREPLWFVLLLLPAVLLVGQSVRRARMLKTIADPALSPWLQSDTHPIRDWSAQALFGLTWFCLVVALAGPRTPGALPDDLQTSGYSAVVIVDLSASMRAEDSALAIKKVSRITAARTLLQQWLQEWPHYGRIGLIVFAGHPHWVIQPTYDHHLLTEFVDQLDRFVPPTLGNDLAGAIELAQQALSGVAEPRLLILTDGDMDNAQRQRAESQLASTTVELTIIGFGEIDASPIPRDPALMTTDRGPILTRLNPSDLESLRAAGNGVYLNASALYDRPVSDWMALPQPRVPKDAYSRIVWREWFAVPLSLAVVAFMLALHWPHRRMRGRPE